MNIQSIGSRRPKLSLAFAGAVSGEAPTAHLSPTLSGTLSRRELRRIVTDLLG